MGTDGLLRVWCVGDVLLRDERLAPDPTPAGLARELSRALDVRLAVVESPPPGQPGSELLPTMVRATRREGFAVRWGRPRITQVGLRAGSVVTLRLLDGDPPDAARVVEVERDGIGERTTEGFGRVLLDPPELLAKDVTVAHPSRDRAGVDGARQVAEGTGEPGRQPSPAAPGDRPSPAAPGARPDPVELAAWRRVIHRRAAALATDRERRERLLSVAMGPARAQLGTLRAQLERLALLGDGDGEEGRALVRQWFETTRGISHRREAWGSALDQAQELLLDRKLVWSRLGLAGECTDLVLGPGRAQMLRARLRVEALIVLVDELLRQVRAEQEVRA